MAGLPGKTRKHNPLPIIVLSQFFGTSLWFAGNAVINDLSAFFGLPSGAVGILSSAVQAGFITGTLVFALLTLADKFSPSKLFFISSVMAALFNLGMGLGSNCMLSLFLWRMMTGFFLAGIYPVGMKIASDYYGDDLDRSLGYLVGALVIGTAFPHLLKSVLSGFNWQVIVYLTSTVSLLGGLVVFLFIPDGLLRKKLEKSGSLNIGKIFSDKNLRNASFGYFGHMWELYAFWVFVPPIINTWFVTHNQDPPDIAVFSFIIIASGGIACVVAGYLSRLANEAAVARWALIISGLCCLLSPLFIIFSPFWLFYTFLILWGMAVVADSPLLSTMIAHNSKPELRGTALTLVNSLGFAITIVSIQLLSVGSEKIAILWLLPVLGIGPIIGLLSIKRM